MKDNKKKMSAVAALILSAIIAPAAYFIIKKNRKPKVPNCGGCLKNCSLDAPTCRIGREKAEKWKNGGPYQEA